MDGFSSIVCVYSSAKHRIFIGMGGLEVLRAQYMPSRFFLLSFYAVVVVVVDVIWTKGNAIHMHASLLFSCGGPAV